MNNVFDDMRAALAQAKDTMRAADACADNMARILLGRLHHVAPYVLVQLKRELQDFDAHKKEWKQ